MLLHHEAEELKKFIESWSVETVVVSFIAFFLLLFVAVVTDPGAVSGAFAGVIALSPIWIPIFLLVFLWTSWIDYIRLLFWFNRKTVLLEIQLPPEVSKSPAAMEVFLSSLFNTGAETTFVNRYWKGGFRPIWTLEIAGNEGRISYYIHGMEVWRPAVESRIYGQFPEAKITEAEDYAARVPFNLEEYELWGAEYKKTNEVQAYPIKTYVDFELNKNTDTPEIQIDPITNLLELMSNMGKDEYLWFQVILKARAKDEWYGIYKNSSDSLKDPAKQEVLDILGRAKKRLIDAGADPDKVGPSMLNMSKDEQARVEAIEHMLSKSIYECGIRIVYVAKQEKFKGVTGAFLFRIFQVLDSGMNRLGGAPGRGMIRFDYPWEDFMGIRERAEKEHLFSRYKNRAYFYVPYDQVPIFMNTEEIATLWHFPNSMVRTPGLNRVPSRVGEAPLNLPTLPS
jgi:hypothetical protein